MKSVYVIVCDKVEEANFAEAWLRQNGYKNIQKTQVAEYKLYELDGNAPNYSFSGKFGRMGENLFEVRAEK